MTETRKKVYFFSDLHLGASYFQDPLEMERHAVKFLDSIKDGAEAIYLLGDVLDYWFEYRYVVPRGYVRFLGKIAELADSGIKITWIVGNHDIWIFDYIPKELGIRVVDGSLSETIHGKCFYMAHGDRCGRQKRMFRFIQHLFRNRFCQFLFAGIHPRWTVPFAYKWSNSNRTGRENCPSMADTHNDALQRLKVFCREYYAKHPDVDHFLFGHLHLVAHEQIASKCDMYVLGDWINHFSYLVLDGEKLSFGYFPLQK